MSNMTNDQFLGALLKDLRPLVKAVVDGFTPDPGTSDLDNEQPIHVTIPLGQYRRARMFLHQLEKL